MEATYLLWGQGLYYLATAAWPLVSMRSFERVTGPKQDHWLVKTVAAMIGVIAIVLLAAAYRGAPSVDAVVLALGSAVALAAVDVIYVAQRRISRIYLLDAAAEAVLLAGWVFTLLG
ncbi:MAG: hypothetical protein ACK47B_18935 [Armatimonadota bacterium]